MIIFQIIGLLIGLSAMLSFMISIIPFLGFLNWLNIPYSLFGVLVCTLSLCLSRKEKSKVCGAIGLALCLFTTIAGILRLVVFHVLF
jgi:hypothetical protein